jgi:hypothetical protein
MGPILNQRELINEPDAKRYTTWALILQIEGEDGHGTGMDTCSTAAIEWSDWSNCARHSRYFPIVPNDIYDG